MYVLRCLKPNLIPVQISFISLKKNMNNNSSDVVNNNIKEGEAEIITPHDIKVFYNPVQEFNRDLSVAVLRVLTSRWKNEPQGNKQTGTRTIKVLEALAATGLRSIRYAKEIPGLTEIIANDLSANAVESLKKNISHNGVENLVKVSHKDACEVMFENRHYANRFDAIDLDPYGCPSVFLDSAVQSVADGGLLLVTCTDMAVLCGNTPNTCYVKYGSISLKNKACHEMALRIILQAIESHATRYKRYIVPLLSVSADFYVRVFVQIFTSAVICKQTTSKLSTVYQCTGCEALTLQPLGTMKTETAANGQKNVKYRLPHAPSVSDACSHCGSKHHMGGPIWSAPIHDPEFVTQLLETVSNSTLATRTRIIGILSVISEELHDVPLYYCLDRLCSRVHSTSLSMMTFRSAVLRAGYRISFSHANSVSIKTDAPLSVLWDIIRAWVAENPVSEKKLATNEVARRILSTPPSIKVNFEMHNNANPLSRQRGLVRFQENPAPFWGPGCRAVVNTEPNNKSIKKQNKKRKRQLLGDSEECNTEKRQS